MPLACSSQRLTKRHRNAPRFSRAAWRPRACGSACGWPSGAPASWSVAPTFSLIDMPLSLRITSMSGSTSPPWFSASNAMPAVIAPSPITATILRSSPLRCAAIAMPSAARDRGGRMADAEGVVLAFVALRERRQAVLLLDRRDAVAAAGEDLVRIALVADVPDQAVARRVVQVVQRDGQLDHAEAGAEMAARASRPIRSGKRATRRATAASSRFGKLCAGRRASRCAQGADSAGNRSLLGKRVGGAILGRTRRRGKERCPRAAQYAPGTAARQPHYRR